VEQLLSTKLYIPSIRPEFVPRPHLIGRLNDGLHRKLTLISASAGFGKTTLVANWCRQADHSTSWLSLDQNDNDPVRFFSYLIAALQKIDPEICQTAQTILPTSQLIDLEPLLINLTNEINEKLGPFFLILDDYHVIAASEIHQAVAFLIDHAPAHMHLIILTRSDPPLPIARLRGRGQLTELHTADLRFSVDEVEAFLIKLMGLRLSHEDILSLQKRTEGWIVGLQLAALSMRRYEEKAAFIHSFTGSQRFTLDYLTEEVLKQQSLEIQTFLLQTSVLERLSGPLCNAVTERTDSQEILEFLEANNLFVFSLDEDRTWYRYHRLFADVLHNQLRSSDPNLIQTIHQRACSWLEEQGFVGHSIHHAIAANDIENASRLVEKHALSMLMQGEIVTLFNWISWVENLDGERAWLSVYKSWGFTLTGQFDLADLWLKNAVINGSALAPETEQALLGHIEAIHAFLASVRGDAEAAIRFAKNALKFLPEDEQTVRSIVHLIIGFTFRLTGDFDQAIKFLQDAQRSGQVLGHKYIELGALTSMSDLIRSQGKLHQAHEIENEVLKLSTQQNGQNLPTARWPFLGLGWIHYEWNNLAIAKTQTQNAIALSQQWKDFINLVQSFDLMSKIYIAQGELDRAHQMISQAENLSRTHALPLTSWVKASRIRYWLAQGNLEAVTHWVNHCGLSTLDEIILQEEAEYLAFTRASLATGDFQRALQFSKPLMIFTEKLDRVGSLIETLNLRALAFQAAKNPSKALTTLARALKLAKPEGYIRTFVDEGKPMESLLRLAQTKGISKSYAHKLLSAFTDNKTSAQPDQHLVDPLSKRELEVLRLIGEGLSNREIAQELVVAVSTIKTHVNHIYRKLDVNSRTQAVAKSQQLGLF
jgi:LuxR family maltose regulon positive regulatory protein